MYIICLSTVFIFNLTLPDDFNNKICFNPAINYLNIEHIK